jgi:hypothetical protein
MLEDLALWTASPGISGYWLIASFAVMIVPMIWLALWYHQGIEKTEGGKELKERQNRVGAHKINPRLSEGIGMARDIAAGRYGKHSMSMQKRVYLVTAIWLIANTAMFGLLIWGQALAKAANSPG